MPNAAVVVAAGAPKPVAGAAPKVVLGASAPKPNVGVPFAAGGAPKAEAGDLAPKAPDVVVPNALLAGLG